jgi:AraC family transcriptional activator of pobA
MKKDIQKYDFKEGLPQEFEILDMGQLCVEFSEEVTTPHRAEFYQILWFEKGSPIHMVDFNSIKTEPNTLVFVNKNSVQQFDTTFNYDGKVILFTDNFFCKEETDVKFLKSTILFNDLISVSGVSISNISSLFSIFIKLIETEFKNSKDHYQSDILRNYLRNLLLLSEREKKSQNFIEIKKGTNLDHVMYFKDLLENQFLHDKLVNSYANQMYITKKRLNTATTSILGLSPKQIIDARIMLEAKRLLVHTNQSVKEISFHLGFDESTNFIKFFRKHHNTTPLEFRESFLP